MEDQSQTCKFPIQSKKLKINWKETSVYGCSEEELVLKNVPNKKWDVFLNITESEEFIFKGERQKEIMVTFNPETSVTIPVLFLPVFVGKNNAVLTIR